MGKKKLIFGPLEESDVGALLILRNSPDFMLTGHSKAQVLSHAELMQELHEQFARDRVDQLVAWESKAKDSCYGTCWIYDLDADARHATYSIYLSEKARRSKVAYQFFAQSIRHFCKNYELRKLYFEVYSVNVAGIKNIKKLGATIEGHLIDYRIHKGVLIDKLIFGCGSQELISRFKIE